MASSLPWIVGVGGLVVGVVVGVWLGRPPSPSEPGAKAGSAAAAEVDEEVRKPQWMGKEARRRRRAKRQEAASPEVESAGSGEAEPEVEPGAPPEVPARLQGPALSSSVTQAMEQAELTGSVETTDCAEQPCIVFARLEGDASLDALTRAEAMQPYEGDELVSFSWASTPGDRLALAYLASGARDEALERRVATRVMEHWSRSTAAPAAD